MTYKDMKEISYKNSYIVREFFKVSDDTMKEKLLRVRDCVQYYRFCKDCQDYHFLNSYRCKYRYCARCQYLRGRKYIDKYIRYFKPDDYVTHIVLSWKNLKNSEIDGNIFMEYKNIFHEMRRMKFWKDSVSGGIYTFEIKFNRDNINPHFHCLVLQNGFMKKKHVTEYLKRRSIYGNYNYIDKIDADNWDERICDIFKYVFKPFINLKYIHTNIKCIQELKGLRMIQSFGTLYGISKSVEQEIIEEMNHERDALICKCGKKYQKSRNY